MAYVASLVSLGSPGASSSWNLDFRSVYLPGNLCSFRGTLVGRIRSYVAICRYSVATDLAEKETLNLLDLKTAHEPILKSNPALSMNTSKLFPWDYKHSKDDEEERNKVFESLGDASEKVEKLEASQTASLSVTKPSRNTNNDYSNGKPVNSTVRRKKSGMRVWRRGNSVTSLHNVVREYNPALSMNTSKLFPWDYKNSKDDEEERNKVFESLADASEKVEKLEASQTASLSVTKPSTNTSNDYSNGKPVNSTVHRKKSGMRVWRRGNSVTSLHNIVKESPKIEKAPYHETMSEAVAKVDSEPVSPPRPLQSPVKVQPRLQGKPSVTPPPTVTSKPLILKNVRATSEAPTTDGTDSVSKMKERKPILIDKYASKRPVVDPSIAQTLLSPTKPKLGKGLVTGKFRADFQMKSNPTSGPQKRIFNNVEFPDKATKLEISIPGVSTKRKGRKWTKASRREARLQAARESAPVKVEILEVAEEGMFIEELAHNLAIYESEILGYIYDRGIRPGRVQKIDRGMVKMICKVYDVEVIDASPHRVEEMARKKEILDEDDLDKLEDRPPVITVMGHVDHGKTTLLDYIRKSKVAVSEVGGITQGIGAYKVLVPIDAKLQPCVFLDTPGHEAFGAMRARGTRVTDIAIIVVAADDGICPQTNEAIAHAKAAGVPIVIAINKIDKDGANPERVMQELASIGLMPEDWGGDVPVVQISALKGEKVDDLLETVMLVAELEELKANPHRCAKGTVIEAGLHKSKGPVGTFIVQNGTLRRGDMVVCGEAFGKVRALFDEKGNRVDEAGPSIPVQVIGISTVPIAGDEFEVVGSLNVAREKAGARAESLRIERLTANADDRKVTLSSLASAVLSRKQSGLDLHELNIVMKADVQGSIEAVRQALLVLPQDNVSLQFLLQATGDISTSDVDLAIISKGIIVGFNVKTPISVKRYAVSRGIEIRMYRVIYDLIDDVRNAMEGLLDLVEEQVKIGSAEVRAVFRSGSGRVAGCMVTEGKVLKDSGIRVVRNKKTVYVGILDSLRRVKEQVKEVKAGLECGIGMDNFFDWKEGDILEAFNTVQKKRTLEDASATMAAAIKEVEIKR